MGHFHFTTEECFGRPVATLAATPAVAVATAGIGLTIGTAAEMYIVLQISSALLLEWMMMTTITLTTATVTAAKGAKVVAKAMVGLAMGKCQYKYDEVVETQGEAKEAKETTFETGIALYGEASTEFSLPSQALHSLTKLHNHPLPHLKLHPTALLFQRHRVPCRRSAPPQCLLRHRPLNRVLNRVQRHRLVSTQV